MQTFARSGRTFSASSFSAAQQGGSTPAANDKEHPHDQTSPQGPSTDEVAKSDAAFSSDTADPKQAKGQIESDTNKSMDSSAASEAASKTPKKNLQTSKSEAQGSSSSNE